MSKVSKKNLKIAEEAASRVGHRVKEVIVVTAEGGNDDFAINTAYEDKVAEMGYRIGSMQRSAPRALGKVDEFDYIAKWYNIGVEDYPHMQGMTLCESNRNGSEALIVIFE